MTNIGEKLKGIIVPLVTPFCADGNVDAESLRVLANYVVDGGVNGVFVAGTTGEFQYLPFEQQRSAIEAVADEIADRSLVVAGVTGNSVEETIRNVIVIGSLPTPPDALAVAPLYYHSNRHLPRHMERLSSLSKLPILLYNNIGIVHRRWKRKDIIPDLVGAMASLSNIVGIKDSSSNPDYFARVMKYESAKFRVFQGEEKSILLALQQGAAGAVPSIGNILPGLCAKLYSGFIKGEKVAAETCQRSIQHIDALYPNAAGIPPILKTYLASKGIIANPVSYIPFPGDKERIIFQLESSIKELDKGERLGGGI